MSESGRVFLLGLLIGIGAMAFAWSFDIKRWKTATVEQGCAAYDTQTGEWGWIEK